VEPSITNNSIWITEYAVSVAADRHLWLHVIRCVPLLHFLRGVKYQTLFAFMRTDPL
jgi:hypothetical protein